MREMKKRVDSNLRLNTSGDHGELGAGELALEEPVAEVDGKVDLVVFGDVQHALLVLHVHGHELVADLRRVLGVVDQAKLLVLDVSLQLRIVFESDAFTLDLLAPPVLVQAFPEEDHVSHYELRGPASL